MSSEQRNTKCSTPRCGGGASSSERLNIAVQRYKDRRQSRAIIRPPHDATDLPLASSADAGERAGRATGSNCPTHLSHGVRWTVFEERESAQERHK